MFDQQHHYGWADQVRRQQTERLHAEMPTVYEPWDNPTRDNRLGLAVWIIASIVSLTCLVVGGLGATGRF